MSKIQYRKWEIDSANFDAYFADHIENMTISQREDIPIELAISIFKGKQTSLTKLTFVQKLFVLAVVFKKQVNICISDPDGISPKTFQEVQKSYRDKSPRKDLIESLRADGGFVLGGVELMKRLEYLNLTSASPLYKVISGARAILQPKTKSIKQQEEINEAVLGVLRFLVRYEGNKKRIATDYKLTIPDWYALMFFYGEERKPAEFYNDAFAYAYTSNRRDLGQALTRLCRMGLMDHRGKKGHSLHYYLTPAGKEMAVKIMERVVLNY